MSLFPAYLEETKIHNLKTDKNPENEAEWLKNTSYNVNFNIASCSSSSSQINKSENPTVSKELEEFFSSDTSEVQEESKRRKKKVKRKKEEKEKKKEETDEFYKIDHKPSKEFLSVKTISRPAVSRYRVKFHIRDMKKKRIRKFKRYFNIVLTGDKEDESNDEQEKLTKKDLNVISKETNDNFTGFKQEEDLSQTTGYYNKILAENPRDIEMWLKYVAFQDTVFQFEKSYRKGSIAKGQRVTAERKLAIIDKALTHNPNCEKLLREHLNVVVRVYPADELYLHLQKLVEKDQSNIILWQGLIESRQCSMSHCTAPKVLDLYSKCLSILHKLRRAAKLEKAVLEENILRMLYQCSLFLKQAGLFEQLWTLLKLYLDLNLSQNKFNAEFPSWEKHLLELEEIVLNSQLPLHELWLRIEKLRESCHWLPYSGGETCEDPQRLVFSEDVAELIHPIATPRNTFKLTATILTLLKIPLLPCRHTTMRSLGIDYVPWAIDSVEALLPVFLPMYSIDTSNKYLINYTQKLAVGPQYLKMLPCQEEYLEFVLNIMKNCADSLSGTNRTAITIWWFRFLRLLVVLEKSGHFKISAPFKKKLKTLMKNVLKQDEHRNNTIFFQEYAFVEYEQGNFDGATNIILTAITANYNGKSVTDMKEESDQANLCMLYRSLIEIEMKTSTEENKQKCLKYLLCFVLGNDLTKLTAFITQGSLNEANIKFKHVYLLLMQRNIEPIETEEHFLPNFFTDFIICYGWFLYVTKGVIECGKLVEETLQQLDERHKEILWQKEILFEYYVAMLYKSCTEKSSMYNLLNDVLFRAIEQYPNNLFLLSVLTKQQSINSTLGQSWWKIKGLLLKTGHALPILFLLLIVNQRMTDVEENLFDTITGQNISVTINLKNKMLALFKTITSPDMCTRRCGLVWRLYLQFLHAYFDPKSCRNAYYQAVEECPWLKALYIDAAIYIPAELSQIQDLLIEKQLRIHVTPEELDILRN